MDVTPTVLRLFGLDVPADMQGHVIEPVAAAEPAHAPLSRARSPIATAPRSPNRTPDQG